MRTISTLCALAVIIYGGAVCLAQPSQTLDGLDVGVRFIEEGDFEAAAEILDAVTFILDGEPDRRSDLARAYLYFGWALLYTASEAEASERFSSARQQDPQLVPTSARFPRRVIRLWEAAGTAETTRPTAPPLPDAVAVADASDDPSEMRGAPIDPSVWFSGAADRLLLQLVLARPEERCPGEMLVDGAQGLLAWNPSDAGSACPTAFQVPFDDVASVGAAEEGGFVVHLSSGDTTRLVFIPEPYRAWFNRGSRGRSHLDLPGEETVAIRLAVRELLTALGRPPASTWSTYGAPVDIAIADLLDTPSAYDGRAVITRGRFTALVSEAARTYSLVSQGAVIDLTPTPESRALIDANAAALDGAALTVTGVFRRRPVARTAGGDDSPKYSISFWSALSEVLASTNRASRPLRDLFEATPVPTDEPVDVIGQYRGGNLFGDLPPVTRLTGGVDDWILRDGDASVWVTGSRPEGAGWGLDLRNKRDTSTWMRVRGRLRQDNGTYYLLATDVAPVEPQSSQSPASPGPLGWGELPPGVQFTLPIAFEGATPDSQFVIQFTKPIDPGTFEGNVVLGYAGSSPGRGFTTVSVRYSEERRTLHIDPGTALERGRQFEILLRPGITDVTGKPLEGATTLTWQVGG